LRQHFIARAGINSEEKYYYQRNILGADNIVWIIELCAQKLVGYTAHLNGNKSHICSNTAYTTIIVA
jgi:hypothetical protein